MNKNLLALLLLGLLQPIVSAADIADEETAYEEITSDSEAAKIEAQKSRMQIEQERAANVREMKNVRDARGQAEQNRQRASETLKISESEMKRLNAEKAILSADIVKFGHDAMVSEKIVEDTKAKVQKLKAEVASMRALRAEKVAKVTALNQQKMQWMREVGVADDQHAVTKRELERALSDEKAAAAELEQSRAEEVTRKAQLDNKIKELKGQIQTARLQTKAVQSDVRKYKAHNRRLEDQINVGSELAGAPAAQPAAPTPAEAADPSGQ
jgi:chromosome segregation ATPase